MNSQLLKKNGLLNYIAGSDYNFRHAIVGDSIGTEFQKAIKKLPQKPLAVYSAEQVHGKQVKYCDGTKGDDFLYGKSFPATDGLITDKVGIALIIKYADCTPIVIYDPVRKVQASLHSGWRGTVQRISQHAIQMMVTDFGCNLEDLLVFLGPSIDQANYEVGTEVYEAFAGFPNLDNYFKEHGEKYWLSMLGANYELLKEVGLHDDQIEQSPYSTYTSPALHSARKEKALYGLNSIITMIPQN